MPGAAVKKTAVALLSSLLVVLAATVFSASADVVTGKQSWNGLDFYPLQDNDYADNQPGQNHAVFKHTESDRSVITAEIKYGEAKPYAGSDEFMKDMKAGANSPVDGYTITSSDIDSFNKFGSYSVVSHKILKSNDSHLMVDRYDYAFVHPDNSKVMVYVSFSGSFEGTVYDKEQFKHKRDRFINGISTKTFSGS